MDTADFRSQRSLNSPYIHALLAGGIAGTTVDLSLYPIDTLKTRLQSSQGFGAAGGFRGVYKGVGSALVGSAPGAALFFVSYESVKSWLAQGGSHYHPLAEPVQQMVAASAGEVAACAVRVPTEVIKQRAQASQHRSSWAALVGTWKLGRTSSGGLRSELYRGWWITVMREIPFTVIQFPLWEGMKHWRSRTAQLDRVSGVESGVFGAVAGAVAAGITTPLDVLKTRMMLATERQHMVPLLRQILRDSGPGAFFAGIAPRILWISAGGAIFLGSYQWAYNELAR